MNEARAPRVKREFDWFSDRRSPLTLFMRKDGTGKVLGWSNLRVLLYLEFAYLTSVDPAAVTMPWVYALLGIPLMLILETVGAMIPVPEVLAGIKAAAMAAGAWAMDRAGGLLPGTTVESSSSSTKTTVPVAPAPAPAPEDPHPVHEWAEGDPHAGLG